MFRQISHARFSFLRSHHYLQYVTRPARARAPGISLGGGGGGSRDCRGFTAQAEPQGLDFSGFLHLSTKSNLLSFPHLPPSTSLGTPAPARAHVSQLLWGARGGGNASVPAPSHSRADQAVTHFSHLQMTGPCAVDVAGGEEQRARGQGFTPLPRPCRTQTCLQCPRSH